MPGREITKQQVDLYMKIRREAHTQEVSAAKVGISVRSGSRIENGDHHPNKSKPRNWRTRSDPFEEIWEKYLEPLLESAPRLQPITLLDALQEKYPGQYPDSKLRTLQRRVREWKALKGPEKILIFRQTHPPGQQGISDFTHLKGVIITINGEAFCHILYHFRLTFSGWSYIKVIVGTGESYTALTEGLQEALWRLGGAPKEHRTDHLTAAFKSSSDQQKREATERYEEFCKNYNMHPTHNNLGEAHENGSIESPNGHLKRRIEQALILRGSYDFKSTKQYQKFIDEVVLQHNRRNAKQVGHEQQYLQALPQFKSVDYDEVIVAVKSSGTIDVKRSTYTVPPRLVGEKLRVHVYNNRLLCYLGANLVHTTERKHSTGKNKRARSIDYRHIIGSLKKKPRAFRYYQFRDDLFPNESYRLIWEYADKHLDSDEACKYIVNLLALAAENDCEYILGEYILEKITNPAFTELPRMIGLKKKFSKDDDNKQQRHVWNTITNVTVTQHNLNTYDVLLSEPTKSIFIKNDIAQIFTKGETSCQMP